MNNLLLKCSCYSHVISVEYDEDKILFIQIMPAKMSFIKRLKYLFTGEPSCIADAVLYEKEISLLKQYMMDIEL